MATDNSTQSTTDKTQYKWENDYYKNLYDEGVKNLNKEYLDTALKAVSQQNQAAYALRKQEQQQAEQSFYQQLYNTNQTVMDTLRKNNASAIASGASKGAQAANELSAILQGQQTGVQASTDLANENYNLAAEAQQTATNSALTATETAQNAAAQAAIGLADTLKTDQAQWVENQISNYLAELASGNTTDSEGNVQALNQTDWLQRAGWLKAHNVDIDFKNDEGYKDAYNKIFAAQSIADGSFTMTTADKYGRDISEVSRNAGRLYKFNLGGSDYQVRAAEDKGSTKLTASAVVTFLGRTTEPNSYEDAKSWTAAKDPSYEGVKTTLANLASGDYYGFTHGSDQCIIFKQSDNNYVIFQHGSSTSDNTKAKNDAGFNALWNSLASSKKVTTL